MKTRELFILIIYLLSTVRLTVAQDENLANRVKVGVNLLAPIPSSQGSAPHFGGFLITDINFFSSSVDIHLEAETFVNEQVSFTVPVNFGISRKKLPDVREEYSPLPTITGGDIYGDYYTYGNIKDQNQLPIVTYAKENRDRRKNLIFETGLGLKWYPWGQRTFTPYIEANFLAGKLDVNAVDTYHSLDTITYIDEYDDYFQGWYMKDGYSERRKNTFWYTRGGMSLGAQANFKNNFGIRFAIGFVTDAIYKGKENDRLFTSFNGSEYVKMHDQPISMPPTNYVFTRFYLNYGFGSIGAKHSIKCKVTKPFRESKISPYKVGVSMNISSLVRTNSWRNLIMFSRNKVVTIEGELAINDRVGVKVSVGTGLDYLPDGENYETVTTYSTPKQHSPDFIFVAPWQYEEIDDLSKFPVLNTSLTHRTEWSKRHTRDLLYEVGIQPKYYFTTYNNVLAPYVGLGLYIGKMNAYAIDFYHEMDTAYIDKVGYNSVNKTLWGITEDKQVMNSSPYDYFRAQVLTGININLSHVIGFGMELAYSTPIKNNGEPDRVYIRKRGTTDYSLVHEEQYKYNSVVGHLSFRLHLIFRLAKRRSC